MQVDQAIAALRERVGISQQLEPPVHASIPEVIDAACAEVPHLPAFTCLGHTVSYGELGQEITAFAAWLQNHTSLVPGDRIAIQMPNLIQYPVVMYGALKAGLTVVNTNPLYTERELVHQFNDAQVKAVVVVANVAQQLSRVLPQTSIEHVVVTELGDMHGLASRLYINLAARYIKRIVPAYSLPDAVPLRQCLALGKRASFSAVDVAADDLALLQYTGGTTGPSKGAMLSHGNIVTNTRQSQVMVQTFEKFAQDPLPGEASILPLPLYHVFACTVCALLMRLHQHTVLIPNPRDYAGFVKTMSNWKVTNFWGLNTIFVSLCDREDFRALDFSSMRITVSGGMALTSDAAQVWEDVTGVKIYEGYGLTETSPVVSINVGDPAGNGRKLGSIGVPVPSTELKVVGDDGTAQPVGEAGELCVRGPQVMRGYWNLPEKTAEVIDAEGWFATGDIAMIDEQGFPHIVDRKKDMIIVSGFNVYPNEVEDVLSSHAKVLECAVVGVPDARAGEKVKAYVVAKDPSLTEQEVIDHARDNLAAYKVPVAVAFMDDLPKSNVGKILRRELRDPTA